MGREVRKVPADWQHPKDSATGHYIPLYDGSCLVNTTAMWDQENEEWNNGFWMGKPKTPNMIGPYEDWNGARPDPADYTPVWPEEQCTHYMMYEDTSEGTPISPAFATPEELAHWLADADASTFADMTATYEQWLATMNRGSCVSVVLTQYSDGTGTMMAARLLVVAGNLGGWQKALDLLRAERIRQENQT